MDRSFDPLYPEEQRAEVNIDPSKIFRKITKSWSSINKSHNFKIQVNDLSNNIPILKVLLNNDINVNALIDSGSTCNIISQELFGILKQNKLVLKNMSKKEKISLLAANDTEIHITSKCLIKVKIDSNTWKAEFLVTNLSCCDMILGVPFLTKTKLILNLSDEYCIFKHKPNSKIPIRFMNTECTKINCIHVGVSDMQDEVDILVRKYPEVFTDKIGKALNLTVDIEVTDNTIVNLRPYHINPPTLIKVKEIINNWLQEGIIEPSTSPYSSPAFLTKHNRLVINYSEINKKIKKVNYPLGDMQNMYQHLQGARFFSVLDLNKSFLQMPLSDKAKELTAFSFIHAKYQFLRIPFGLQIGSSQLSAYLDSLFSDVKYVFLLNFCDDLLIYSKDKESHIKHLNIVLSRLEENHLTVNMSKAKLFCTEISFLGNIISHNKVSIDQSRTANIRNFPRPRCVKDIKRFLGMTGFFSKYLDNYAKICLPLNQLRKKNVKFKFDQECIESFEILKQKISNPPVLSIANFEKPFVLMTDASSTTAGGCLLQKNSNDDLLPIAYFSRKFSDAEQKYSVYEKEALSVIMCMNKWEEYLKLKPFKLICDNQALTYVLNAKKKLNSRLSRWVECLLQMPFEVEFCRSGDNVIADALSRMYESRDDSFEKNIDDVIIKSIVEPRDKENLKINPPKTLHNSKSGVNNMIQCGLIQTERVNKCKNPQPPNTRQYYINLISEIPLAFTELKEHQNNDPECIPILQSIKNKSNNLSYFIKNDVLMYKPSKGLAKIYLPSNLINLVFSYYHNSLIGGHLGFYKTYNKIHLYFYRPNLSNVIKEKTQNCHVCKMSKSVQQKFQGKLISHPITTVMNTIFVDLCGPFNRSKSGNQYILVVVDSFSRYVWLSAIRNCTSELVINKLKPIFENFGFVQNLVSDNGSCFTSNSFKKFCFKHFINHRLIAPYRAQSNKCERFIRNVMQCLRCYYSKEQRNFDSDLGLIQCALNSAKSEATKCSPFYLMFNRNPICSLSNIWRLDDLIDDQKPKESIAHNLKQAVKNVKRSLEMNNKRKKYDQQIVQHPFKLQSIVYLKTHLLSNREKCFSKKLASRYEGPYRILHFITPVTCIIQRCNDVKSVKKVPICDLKLG